MAIHPTAVIDDEADLHPTVEVGPYAVIGPQCRIGAGCRLGPFSYLKRNVVMGCNNTVSGFSSIGIDPQDLKYADEETWLYIGDRNDIREYVTISRGTCTTKGGKGKTVLGNENMIMAYAHIAHDCVLGDQVIMANAATLAGHIAIGDHATVGGLSAVHQFVRIGTHAFIAGGSMAAQDVPPYHLASGEDRARLFGLNVIGLQRKGFSNEQIVSLKRASRRLFRSGEPQDQALAALREEYALQAEVATLLDFVSSTKRGICK